MWGMTNIVTVHLGVSYQTKKNTSDKVQGAPSYCQSAASKQEIKLIICQVTDKH